MLTYTILDSLYRAALLDNLRDAALSAAQFVHMGVGLLPPQGGGDGAMADMHEKGYGPRREITELKMWPRIELPQAPEWARKQD